MRQGKGRCGLLFEVQAEETWYGRGCTKCKAWNMCRCILRIVRSFLFSAKIFWRMIFEWMAFWGQGWVGWFCHQLWAELLIVSLNFLFSPELYNLKKKSKIKTWKCGEGKVEQEPLMPPICSPWCCSSCKRPRHASTRWARTSCTWWPGHARASTQAALLALRLETTNPPQLGGWFLLHTDPIHIHLDTVGLTRFYWILSSNPAILVEILTRITEFEERIQ